jgi:hypothetical protein
VEAAPIAGSPGAHIHGPINPATGLAGIGLAVVPAAASRSVLGAREVFT